MKFLMENEDIEQILLQAGYSYYGQSKRIFKKLILPDEHSPYFHASIDYNYPQVELHIDIPVPRKRKNSLQHETIKKSTVIYNEYNKIMSFTLEGKLHKVFIDIMSQLKNPYEKPTRNIQRVTNP